MKLTDGESLTLFDPTCGVVIREPQSTGLGFWAGAPGVYDDQVTGLVYLLYRIRRPRGVSNDRGAELRLAVSRDGVNFDDIWNLRKEQLPSASIERCAFHRSPDGTFVLYVSYVDPADGRWRIDAIQSRHADQFDITLRQSILTADQIDVEGVKDPWIMRHDGRYIMVASYATAAPNATAAQLHASSDAYNTGLVKSRTGWASGRDAIHFDWHGELLSPSLDGWDAYATRVACIWRERMSWCALYDGSASVAENYEERCGLAVGDDWRHLSRVTVSAPIVTVPYATGSVRYADVIQRNDRLLFYYEMSRPDGSHELRCITRRRPMLGFSVK